MARQHVVYIICLHFPHSLSVVEEIRTKVPLVTSRKFLRQYHPATDTRCLNASTVRFCNPCLVGSNSNTISGLKLYYYSPTTLRRTLDLKLEACTARTSLPAPSAVFLTQQMPGEPPSALLV